MSRLRDKGGQSGGGAAGLPGDGDQTIPNAPVLGVSEQKPASLLETAEDLPGPGRVLSRARLRHLSRDPGRPLSRDARLRPPVPRRLHHPVARVTVGVSNLQERGGEEEEVARDSTVMMCICSSI